MDIWREWNMCTMSCIGTFSIVCQIRPPVVEPTKTRQLRWTGISLTKKKDSTTGLPLVLEFWLGNTMFAGCGDNLSLYLHRTVGSGYICIHHAPQNYKSKWNNIFQGLRYCCLPCLCVHLLSKVPLHFLFLEGLDEVATKLQFLPSARPTQAWAWLIHISNQWSSY